MNHRGGFLMMLGLAPVVAVVPAAAAPAWSAGPAWAIKPTDTKSPLAGQLLRDAQKTSAVLEDIERQHADWTAVREQERRERDAIVSISHTPGAV